MFYKGFLESGKNVTLNFLSINLLSVNPTKWSNTLKQFVGFSVLGIFGSLVLEGIRVYSNAPAISNFNKLLYKSHVNLLKLFLCLVLVKNFH